MKFAWLAKSKAHSCEERSVPQWILQGHGVLRQAQAELRSLRLRSQDKRDKCRAPADTKTASALPVRRGYRPVVCEGSTVNGCSMRNSSNVSLGTRTCWP